MPNVLEIRYREKKRDAIYEICDTLLAQERRSVETRKDAGEPSVWDGHREQRLAAIPSSKALHEKTHQKLAQIASVLLENVHTRSAFTVGILRDILLSCVYASPGLEFEALGHQIADKILHQLQGEPKVLEVVVDLCKDFPNAEELRDLAKRMGAFAVEKRIRPLV
jgi:hypothetical protein